MVKSKNIWLIVVVILIVLAIFALEKTKNENNTASIFGSSNVNVNSTSEIVKEKEKIYQPAKELVSPDGYINTDHNITISEFVGKKVILVDFWTYSCVNCIRTLPYLNAWYDKYKDSGLVIIGVHSPEFEFEKDYSNVKKAVEKYGINYPVIQDNEMQTWQAYKNNYWPRDYLIDIDGFVAYDHIGEGDYNETEKEIQSLLQERDDRLGINASINENVVNPNIVPSELDQIGTPELYFGYGFDRVPSPIGNLEGFKPEQTVDYKIPTNLEDNKFYLEGSWKNNVDSMELVGTDGTVELNYNAKNVNIVAESDNGTNVTVYVDGIEKNVVNIKGSDLYPLVMGSDYGKHQIKINASTGLKIYTFTFG